VADIAGGETRAYLVRNAILSRFKVAVTLTTKIKLQGILAMTEAVRTEVATEYLGGGVTCTLFAEMAGESLEIPAITYPRDWIEAVKERFLPRWARRRWPVSFSYVVWDATVLYPMISLPEEDHYLSEVRVDIREGDGEK